MQQIDWSGTKDTMLVRSQRNAAIKKRILYQVISMNIKVKSKLTNMLMTHRQR